LEQLAFPPVDPDISRSRAETLLPLLAARDVRRKLGVTQQQLAKKLDVGRRRRALWNAMKPQPIRWQGAAQPRPHSGSGARHPRRNDAQGRRNEAGRRVISDRIMDDPYSLDRFVEAQQPIYGQVCTELRHGRKASHWMWFVFPQIQGLGHSPIARHFAVASLAEAQTYLDHPSLGPRLRECTQLVLDVQGRTAQEIFGHPDDMKFRSSMTLFALAAPDEALFKTALTKYFPAGPDPETLARV
jgi:uncharacterized protein (DUF1810 family)